MSMSERAKFRLPIKFKMILVSLLILKLSIYNLLVSVAMGESFFVPRFFAVKEMWYKSTICQVIRLFQMEYAG